jgi:uncharacterized protein
LFQKGLRCYLGECEPQNFQEAIRFWEMAAEQGHLEARIQLGHCAFEGKGMSKNPEIARRHWEKAALEGSTDAVFHLGSCADTAAETARFWQQAATAGHARAQYLIGRCYENGEVFGGSDTEKAYYWYQLSAAQGWAPAKEKLAQYQMSTGKKG